MRLTAFIFLLCSFALDKSPEKCYRSFQQWYQGHQEQLVVQQDTNSLLFEARYLPNEVTICQQIFKSEGVTKRQLKTLYETYDTYEEYSFKIQSLTSRDLLIDQSEDKADYQNKQFYLIESVQQDFVLLRDNDTLHPLSCQFENNYGTAPYIMLHLTFEKPPKGQRTTSQLIYNDQLFGSDQHTFDFTHLMNLQIPKIK